MRSWTFNRNSCTLQIHSHCVWYTYVLNSDRHWVKDTLFCLNVRLVEGMVQPETWCVQTWRPRHCLVLESQRIVQTRCSHLPHHRPSSSTKKQTELSFCVSGEPWHEWLPLLQSWGPCQGNCSILTEARLLQCNYRPRPLIVLTAILASKTSDFSGSPGQQTGGHFCFKRKDRLSTDVATAGKDRIFSVLCFRFLILWLEER